MPEFNININGPRPQSPDLKLLGLFPQNWQVAAAFPSISNDFQHCFAKSGPRSPTYVFKLGPSISKMFSKCFQMACTRRQTRIGWSILEPKLRGYSTLQSTIIREDVVNEYGYRDLFFKLPSRQKGYVMNSLSLSHTQYT